MNNIIITGATSMIGIATVKAALADGVSKIYAVIRDGNRGKERLPKSERIKTIECPLGKYDMLPSLIDEPCDAFYHFAWEASQKEKLLRYFDVEIGYRNVGYILEAYRAAYILKCKKFIGAGSQAEYGEQRQDVQKPDDITNPITCYGIAKDMARRMLMVKSKEYGVNVQWVRIFSVYGSLDRKNTLISTALTSMLMNKDINLTESTQIWDYLYESDAGKAMYLIGRDAIGNNIFCLGNGAARPLRDYLEIMKDITRTKSILKYGAVPYGKDSVMCLHPDISKIKAITSWKGPEISFEEGIENMIKEGESHEMLC